MKCYRLFVDDRGYVLERLVGPSLAEPLYRAGCRGPWTADQCRKHWLNPRYPDSERGMAFCRALERSGRLAWDLPGGIELLDLISVGARIHPRAKIGVLVRIGVDAFVEPGARLGDRSRIGSETIVDYDADIGADADVGPYCYIGVRAIVPCGVRVPEGTLLRSGTYA